MTTTPAPFRRPSGDPASAATSPVSVIVHYGDPGPTVTLANEVLTFGSRVVVVANDLAPRPTALSPAAEWIVPDRNLGYAQAFMLAVRGRPGPAVLLNTDIVLPRDTFDRCLRVLCSEPDVGVVAPVLLKEDGSLQSGAARLSRWRRAPQVLVDPGGACVECAWVTGAVMFIRREVVDEVGMDGSYFLGNEDVDLCLRARAAGWRVLCCGDAPAVHHESRVIGGRWYYYGVRNRVWFARAHFGRFAAALNWLHALVMLPRVALADLLKRRNFTSSKLNALALRDAWRSKPSMQEGPLPDEPLPARVMHWG